MTLGLKFGQCEAGDADWKAKANDVTVKFLETFRNKNGFYMCRELLGCDLAANCMSKSIICLQKYVLKW